MSKPDPGGPIYRKLPEDWETRSEDERRAWSEGFMKAIAAAARAEAACEMY